MVKYRHFTIVWQWDVNPFIYLGEGKRDFLKRRCPYPLPHCLTCPSPLWSQVDCTPSGSRDLEWTNDKKEERRKKKMIDIIKLFNSLVRLSWSLQGSFSMGHSSPPVSPHCPPDLVTVHAPSKETFDNEFINRYSWDSRGHEGRQRHEL